MAPPTPSLKPLSSARPSQQASAAERGAAAIPDVIVTNLHRRFTGVSATVAALHPLLNQSADDTAERGDDPAPSVGVVDSGGLALAGELSMWRVLRYGWSKPRRGKFRVWHARRDVEMVLGIVLRSVLRQPWRLLFTSAAPKRHGVMLRAIIGRMDAIIATSTRAASFLDWHSYIVAHGIDTKRFHPPEHGGEDISPRGASPSNTDGGGAVASAGGGCIATIGRVRASKGTDVFVEVMLRLLPRFLHWNAVIIGECRRADRAFRDELIERIAKAGLSERVRFVAPVSKHELVRWYQGIDLYLAPSRREGYGLTPFESLACGVVVVTSDTGVWASALRGDFARVVAAGDVAATAAAAEHFMTMKNTPQRLSELGTRARDFVCEHHSIEAEAAALRNIYAALQSGSPAPRVGASST